MSDAVACYAYMFLFAHTQDDDIIHTGTGSWHQQQLRASLGYTWMIRACAQNKHSHDMMICGIQFVCATFYYMSCCAGAYVEVSRVCAYNFVTAQTHAISFNDL